MSKKQKASKKSQTKSVENNKANKAPQVEAPKVETKEEEKVEEPKVEEVQTPANPMNEFTEQVKKATARGLDPNRTVDLLSLSHSYFHDADDAAKRYGIKKEVAETMDKCTAIGVMTMFAQEVALADTPWSRTMRPAVLENMAEVAKEIGVTINLKSLPAPDKNGNVTITQENVKVSAETKKKLKEEKEVLDNGPEVDVDKIENKLQLRKSLLFFLSERQNYLENIQKAISLYAAYLEKEKADATKGMTRIQLLHGVIELVGEAPIVMNGIGSFLYTVTSTSKSPISAFCHLKNTVTDRKTGKCDYDDQFIADVVREIIIWKANIKKAETKKSIEAVEKNLEVLKKDEKKNETAIKDQEERLETLKHNLEVFDVTIKYVISPDDDVVESFLDKCKEKDATAMKIFKSLRESLYRGVDLHGVKQDSLVNNMKMQAGVITNLFRDPLCQMVNYKPSEIPELQFMSKEELEATEKEVAKAEEAKEEEPKEAEESKNQQRLPKKKFAKLVIELVRLTKL